MMLTLNWFGENFKQFYLPQILFFNFQFFHPHLTLNFTIFLQHKKEVMGLRLKLNILNVSIETEADGNDQDLLLF